MWSVECQPSPPEPSQSIASLRCSTCSPADPSTAASLNLTLLVETDVAQFYSYSSQGSILVYFVARATFSEAPSQLQLTDFDVEDGIYFEFTRSYQVCIADPGLFDPQDLSKCFEDIQNFTYISSLTINNALAFQCNFSFAHPNLSTALLSWASPKIRIHI